MDRIQAWADVVNGTRVLVGQDPLDDLLFDLIVHVTFADGHVDDPEFDVLTRLFPFDELGEVLVRVADLADHPFDPAPLLEAWPAPTDRRRLLALAEAMCHRDGHVAEGEADALAALRSALVP